MFLLVNPLLISPCRTSVYTPDTVKPIFDKIQLEKIKADDDIHTKKIRPVDGTESPAFSYHPLIRLVIMINFPLIVFLKIF